MGRVIDRRYRIAPNDGHAPSTFGYIKREALLAGGPLSVVRSGVVLAVDQRDSTVAQLVCVGRVVGRDDRDTVRAVATTSGEGVGTKSEPRWGEVAAASMRMCRTKTTIQSPAVSLAWPTTRERQRPPHLAPCCA